MYQERVPAAGSSYSASLVAGDGKLYLTSEDGEIYVIKAGPKFELLATNSMGEALMATPAISDGMLIVRGQHHLFSVAVNRRDDGQRRSRAASGAFAHKAAKGLRGEAAAIADAQSMVETMGGMIIWSQLKSVHFVHEWFQVDRVDSYVENEILDLTGPRSWVDRKSEINQTTRAYSPEGKRWSITKGKFEYGSADTLEQDLRRAAFNFYRLVRAVAVGDPSYEVRLGEGDIPGTRRLEFYSKRVVGGWIILNARKEPIVKATTEYRYTLGPLKRFGNLRVPAWGVYYNGFTRYEMVSLTGNDRAPEATLFLAPAEFRKQVQLGIK